MRILDCGHPISDDEEYYSLPESTKTGTRVKTLCKACVSEGIPVINPPTTVATITTPSKGIVETIPDLTPAEKNQLLTEQLIRQTYKNFLEIGQLLKENRDNAWWQAGKHESFSNYLEYLNLKHSTAYLMIQMVEFKDPRLNEAEIVQLGPAKMQLLMAAHRQGKLTDDIIEIAKQGAPILDIKEVLGHKIPQTDKEYSIICPRCFVAINGARWVSKSEGKGD